MLMSYLSEGQSGTAVNWLAGVVQDAYSQLFGSSNASFPALWPRDTTPTALLTAGSLQGLQLLAIRSAPAMSFSALYRTSPALVGSSSEPISLHAFEGVTSSAAILASAVLVDHPSSNPPLKKPLRGPCTGGPHHIRNHSLQQCCPQVPECP